MKGTNTMILNSDTVQEAIEYYLKQKLMVSTQFDVVNFRHWGKRYKVDLVDRAEEPK